MPKLKPGTIMPTPEEDSRIQSGIDSDPDAYSLSDEEWERVKPLVRIGRPKAEITKERITIRLSHDVVTQFRATGNGWQTRIDAALKEWLGSHSLEKPTEKAA
ncbi:MAG: BrnA antitoxin family protein [Nitrospirae bacterium]|nr:BrnA antitoxin family protein [Nitrospirota bacterium]